MFALFGGPLGLYQGRLDRASTLRAELHQDHKGTERLRTLFVTVDPAWPPISGSDLRNWQNAVAARAQGPVALASLVAADHGTATPDIPCFSLTSLSSGAIWSSHISSSTFPADTDARFAATVRDFAPDVVVLEHNALAPLIPAARRDGTRIVVDMHNVESAVAARSARGLRPWHFKRRRSAREKAQACIDQERQIAAAADAIWVCSPSEAAALIEATGSPTPVHVIPNGIPRPERAPGTLMPPRPRNGRTLRLIFVGHLDYVPNIQAAQWLATRIFPAARSRYADIDLLIAGRRPAPVIQGLASLPNVSVEADPDDIESLLSAADIAAMPLRAGGGTRIKALEAMSRGLPIVATRMAVDGLGLIDNIHYRPAESTRAFANAIAALAADPAAYASLRGAAWRHCLQSFSPGAVARAVKRGLSPP